MTGHVVAGECVRMLFRGADEEDEEAMALEHAGARLVGLAALALTELQITLPPTPPEPEPELPDEDE